MTAGVCPRDWAVAVLAVLLLLPISDGARALTAPQLWQAEKAYEPARALYREALDAARDGDWARFAELRRRLDDYPLSPYLRYEELLARRHRLAGSEARAFVERNDDSPLGVRFLGHYLRAAGERRRWEDYLAAASREPRSESLRCFYHRARLAGGEREPAWDGARRLWLAGHSVDDACDPLFAAWRRAGQLSDTLVWERALLAFDARRGSLLRYIASHGSAALAGDLEVLRRVYREPQRALRLARDASDGRRRAIVARGLVRLSRYDPARALQLWRAASPADFSAADRARVEAAIALRGLIEHEEAVRGWIDASLARWGDDRLTALRLRWAIAERDWPGLLALSQHLTAAESADALWRYWRARALEALGERAQAQPLYAAVAKRRSYYGFLAAERLGLPHSFNEAPVAAPDTLPAVALPAALRVQELQALEESRLALSEWAHVLPRIDRDSRRTLASLAAQRNWWRLAIDAANESGSWDALDLRFPLAYSDAFRRRALGLSLPVSELMAIARRESAFFPAARSSAGARGLMQLLPSTARGLARREGLRIAGSDLYRVDANIQLGSAYYRQLLERFDGNRAVALAAYNAGPNRVRHWIGKGLPVDAWIETIPYRETRDYVKAVLAYSVVFEHRLGERAQLLSAAELQGAY